jgi:pimeloyl-ACP methyl ester carboxylesterase
MPTVTSHDGTTIAFDRSGEGPALIFVSGAFHHRHIDPSTPQPGAPPAPRFTLYSYDRRGRGESGDTPPYKVEREVDDLQALIDEAGGSAFVFGHSSGAVLALHAAARGLAIRKLALYEPPFIVDDSRPPIPHNYLAHLNELIGAGRRGDAVEYFMTAAVGMPAEAVAPMRNTPMMPALEAVAHTLPYDGAIMGDTLSGSTMPLNRWSSLEVPTLVMDGGASPAWQRSAVQALVDVLPNAQRRTMEGQTHGVAPELLAPVFEEFFTSEQS